MDPLSMIAGVVTLGTAIASLWKGHQKKKLMQMHQKNMQKKNITKGGAKSYKTPGGGSVSNIPTLPPEMQKKIEESLPKFLDYISRDPGKFPELAELIKTGIEQFGVPEKLRQYIPDLSNITTFDFDKAVAQPEMRRFEEEIIPRLAEMETAQGGEFQPSSAFARQKATAARKLSENLASLRAEQQPKYDLERAGLGLRSAALRGQLQQSEYAQKMGATEAAMKNALMQRAPEERQRDTLLRFLLGGVASPYTQVAEPAQPGFGQQFAYGFGKALPKIGVEFAKSYLGTSGY